MKRWLLFAVALILSFASSVISHGADSNETRHPLEGTWRLLKWKDAMAVDYVIAPRTEVEQKSFSTNQSIWLVYDAKTKQVDRGMGASFAVKGDRIEEVPRFIMGPHGPVEMLDIMYGSNWSIKDGHLHTWTKVNGVITDRIWERVENLVVQPPPTASLQIDEADGAKMIQELGGQFEVDPQQPEKPVVSVTLNGGNITDADLKVLKMFKSLRSLKLNAVVSKSPPRANGRITDIGLKQLKELKNLQSLDLAGQTQITDAGLTELKALENLQTLVLRHNNITDAGMKELRELKNLHTLNLKFTKVTVAGLHKLRELKSLRTLILGNNKVTDRSYVDALKAELPNVEIFEESYGR